MTKPETNPPRAREQASAACMRESRIFAVIFLLASAEAQHGTDTACTPRSPAEVAARILEIQRVVRNDKACTGALGLLKDTPTAAADKIRKTARRCNISVAETLGVQMEGTPWRERAYAAGLAAGLDCVGHQNTQAGCAPMFYVTLQLGSTVILTL